MTTIDQVGAEMMLAQQVVAAKPSMFIAGDHDAANRIAAKRVTDLEFEAFQTDDLKQARNLEHLAMISINQSVFRDLGKDWAFGVFRNAAAGA